MSRKIFQWIGLKQKALIALVGLGVASNLVYLSVRYQDSFYAFVALISLTITTLLLIERFSTYQLSIPYSSAKIILENISSVAARFVKLFGLKRKASKHKRIYKFYKDRVLIFLFLGQITFFFILMFFYLPASPNNSVDTILSAPLLLSQSSKAFFIQRHLIFWIVIAVWATLVIKTSRKLTGLKTDVRNRLLSIIFGLTYLFSSVAISIFVSLLTVAVANRIEIKTIERALASAATSSNYRFYTKVEEILEQLSLQNTLPRIIGNETDASRAIILSIIQENQFRSEFYKRNITPLLLNTYPPQIQIKHDLVYLPNNTLIVTQINKDTFQLITPNLSRKIVQQQLEPRYIKEEPKTSILSKQEYIVYRDKQIDEQVAEVDGYIAEVQRAINLARSAIAEAKNKIAVNKNGLETSIAERDGNYQYCMTQASKKYCYTYYGYTYCYPSSYTEDYCNQQKAQWDSIIQGFEQNIRDWETTLSSAQNQIAKLQETHNLFKSYREIVESQRDTILYELGIFEPPNSVKVVLENVDTQSLADFFATATHEYLHYTSYISEGRVLPRFFEEGLTEYFSRKSIVGQLKQSSNIGYPIVVKIISQMVEDIGEDKFIDIYFNKDDKLLITLLNERYGKLFYEDSQYYFSVIPLLPVNEALKLANNIMFNIGGAEIEESDL